MDQRQVEDHRYYATATRDSKLAYWSALLSVNGILVAAFSIVAISESTNRWYSIIAVILSLIACGIIISNFRDLIRFYTALGTLDVDGFDTMSEETKKRELDEATAGYRTIKNREHFVMALLYLESVFIVLNFVSRLWGAA